MRLSRLILFLIFVLFASAALAAKSEKSLVCHVGNELGSNSESYQDNPNCDILPPYDGDPADYICPDAGKVDLILVSKKAKHIGNDAHSFLDDTDYLWEDYSPEEGIGDDPLDFEEGDVLGIDRGCELVELACPCQTLYDSVVFSPSATVCSQNILNDTFLFNSGASDAISTQKANSLTPAVCSVKQDGISETINPITDSERDLCIQAVLDRAFVEGVSCN